MTSRRRFLAVLVGGLCAIGLTMTASRSALLALVGALLLVSPLLAWLPHRPGAARVIRLVALTSVATLTLLLFGLAQPDRLAGLVIPDATVEQRAAALRVVSRLAAEHPLSGVGYNTFQFAAREAGLISDFTIHSRAGADNSLLTLGVTTGLVGVSLWLLPWAAMLQQFWWRWWSARSGSALAAGLSLVIIFLHSFMVNSWLYSHLLITLIIMVALALTAEAPHRELRPTTALVGLRTPAGSAGCRALSPCPPT